MASRIRAAALDCPRPGSLDVDGRRPGAPRRAPGLLRRGRDGDQGAGVDGAGLRAARVLLPRDRPQPARRRPLPRPRAWCSSTTSPRCPPGAPLMLSAHGSAPEVVAAARANGRLRRRRGVPARHQGAPRGEGAGRQGLPHRLRRPRGPRGGGRHDGGRARRRSTSSSRVADVDALPAVRRARRAARADHALAPRLGRRRSTPPASASRAVDARAAATSASPPPTASRR